jgi:hypothetical protein
MPPRARKSEDDKQKDYDDWLAGHENSAIDEFIGEMNKTKFDNSFCDIWEDWTEFLKKFHNLV